MLNVVCLNVGDYQGRGTEYVSRLCDGVKRHMPIKHRFIVFTDDAQSVPSGAEYHPVDTDLPNSWWAKIFLWKPLAFGAGERCLYLDLDTAIVGDLSDIASYRGPFAMLNDMYYPDRGGSAVMAWEAGAQNDHIWENWDRAGRPQFDPHGDQAWIEAMTPGHDRWQAMLPRQFVSFKAHCLPRGGIPADARVLCFHGRPRPHEVTQEWARRAWNPNQEDT